MTPQTPPLKSHVKRPSIKWANFKDDPGLQAYFNSPYTKQLLKIMEEAYNSLERNTDYDCPCWAYKQADINGRLAMINIMKDLLTNE